MTDMPDAGSVATHGRAAVRVPTWLVGFVVAVAFGASSGIATAKVTVSPDPRDLGGASDGATILALAGVRDFAQRADLAALMMTPVGADSMLMKAKVFVGAESMGTYVVRVVRVGLDAFRLRSTGRLVSGGTSMVCNLDVFVQIDEAGSERPRFDVSQLPLCNGSRHDSAVTRISNIGS